MSPERWQQIEEVFQNALDLSLFERESYVVAQRAGDAELQDEVNKLLIQFDEASGMSETPVCDNTQVGVFSSQNRRIVGKSQSRRRKSPGP